MENISVVCKACMTFYFGLMRPNKSERETDGPTLLQVDLLIETIFFFSLSLHFNGRSPGEPVLAGVY